MCALFAAPCPPVVYDIQRGRGVLFRDHRLIFHGPSTRWGFDLHPEDDVLDYTDDVSVSALHFIAR